MPDAPVQQTFTVTDADTAIAVGSGSLPVLGTPRLIAWCEAVTCAALADLPDGWTSVGTRVEIDHVAPNAVGDEVVVSADIVERTDRIVEFAVTARRGEQLVGRGRVVRAVVDADRFMARLAARDDA
ncbi:MAG TPA: thioesterase [Intrasporangiaceae bacterium]|nr:thioesterase [Intrasporangiaceae bacterium]